MESDKSWNFEKDVILIEMVKSRPGLYDLQSSYYSNAHYKKQAWKEIEKAIGQSGAKTRWESLRGQYRKYLSKLRTKSGQAAAKIMKWRFVDQMEFLSTYINAERPRLSSINEDNIEETIDDDESTPVVPKKETAKVISEEESDSSTFMKYLIQEKESEPKENHPIDIFFSLMSATVKNFSPRDQHIVKNRVFNLVSEIEEKYLSSSPSSPFSSSPTTDFLYQPHTSHFIAPPPSTITKTVPCPSTPPPAHNYFNNFHK